MRPYRFRVATAGMLLAGLVFAEIRLNAWEGDVHYVLTRWLAVKAGFSDADAEVIAAADLRRDQGWVQPATMAMPHALFRGDTGAAEDVRDKHFPVDASLPNPPAKRIVQPGNQYAWDPVHTIVSARAG